MRVLMLSWEYPPRIVGGIARHVYDLSNALVEEGVAVDVITCEHEGVPSEEVEGGVNIHRVPVEAGNDFIHWVQNLNTASAKRAGELLGSWSKNEPVLIHSHDWLSEFAGKDLKLKYKLPLVATVHATEYGRNQGIHTDLQRYIHGVEWELCFEAWRVICCSHFMEDEIAMSLKVPREKMDIIANGVDASKFEQDLNIEGFRERYAAPDEKIVFFVGRMVREKGVQVLVEAAPEILRSYGGKVRFVIVGKGAPQHLVQRVNDLGIADKVTFTGYVDDETLLKLYRVADVAVYPSLYEPFGIVALEAMAAKVPVVVSDVGGLREVVDHGTTGLTAWADNPESLTWAIFQMLRNPYSAEMMAKNAYRKVKEQFNWQKIAQETIAVYDRVWKEYVESDWAK